jgi:hypothetical protein
MPPAYHLEPIDEDDPAAGYRGVVDPAGFVDREAFAQALVDEGLPTDAETVLALCEAEQAAMASLMREGWDVAVPGGIAETPWPDAEKAARLGGTVSGRATAGKDQVRRRMIEHGIPHKHSHVEAFFSAQEQVTLRLLLEGYEIEHPIGRMSTTIVGRFDGPDDEFDPQRHEVDIEFGDLDVRDWLEGYREMMRRKLADPPRPLLDGYEDANTGRIGDYLRAGHMVCLRGYWLRFRRSDPEQGVFFIAEDGATRRVASVAFTGLCEAAFVLPRDLPSGLYRLEVRTVLIPRDGLQRGALPDPILVAARAA